jgi:hypothetical protein
LGAAERARRNSLGVGGKKHASVLAAVRNDYVVRSFMVIGAVFGPLRLGGRSFGRIISGGEGGSMNRGGGNLGGVTGVMITARGLGMSLVGFTRYSPGLTPSVYSVPWV